MLGISLKFLSTFSTLAEECFAKFLSTFSTLAEECFATDSVLANRPKRNRFVNPWITSGIIASVKRKNHLHRQWNKTVKVNDKEGDLDAYQKYKTYRKTLKHIIAKAKKTYYGRKFGKVAGNSKKTWELINEIRGKKRQKIKPQFIIDSQIIKDRRAIANAFNNFFTSIAENMNKSSAEKNHLISSTDVTSFMSRPNERSMFMRPCDLEEISNIIRDLDNNKASDIPIHVIKNCNHVLSPYLTHLFNNLMVEGIFPQTLKTGKITPIHKKSDPQLLDNYRPVSTLPIFGKIFEKVIYSRIYNFLLSKNILYDKQFGFRKNHSTSHAVNYSVDKILTSIENKKHVIGIFIDLSKAFDTINHKLLLTKLEIYGIRGICLKLIQSYLTNREQYTKFHEEISDKGAVKYGVPQGSVLGPLLFLIYINDIVNCSKEGHFVLFADDTNIFVIASSEKEAYKSANKVLSNVHKYMLSNQLHINLSKCIHMHFCPSSSNANRLTCARERPYQDHRQLTLSVDSQKIKKVDCARFLGVIIDDKLSWGKHFEHLEKKLLSQIVLIKRIKDVIPKSEYLNIYHSLFLSHMTYCISSWGGVSTNKLERIFAIQKRCIRILFGKKVSFDHPEFYLTCARVRTIDEHRRPKNYCLEHTKPLFNENDLLTVHNLYLKHIFMECFKIVKNRCPSSIYELFNHSRSSRRNFIMINPKVHLNVSKENFVCKASTIWNHFIDKVLKKPQIDQNLNYIIPGSCKYSDLCTPIQYAKNKIFNLLVDAQKQGDADEWHNSEFLLHGA